MYLRSLGTRLIDIHSQHQNLMLGDSRFQLDVVDVLADNEIPLILYRRIQYYQSLKRDLKELTEENRVRISRKITSVSSWNSCMKPGWRMESRKMLEQEQETWRMPKEIKGALWPSKITELLSGDEQGGLLPRNKGVADSHPPSSASTHRQRRWQNSLRSSLYRPERPVFRADSAEKGCGI